MAKSEKPKTGWAAAELRRVAEEVKSWPTWMRFTTSAKNQQVKR